MRTVLLRPEYTLIQLSFRHLCHGNRGPDSPSNSTVYGTIFQGPRSSNSEIYESFTTRSPDIIPSPSPKVRKST